MKGLYPGSDFVSSRYLHLYVMAVLSGARGGGAPPTLIGGCVKVCGSAGVGNISVPSRGKRNVGFAPR